MRRPPNLSSFSSVLVLLFLLCIRLPVCWVCLRRIFLFDNTDTKSAVSHENGRCFSKAQTHRVRPAIKLPALSGLYLSIMFYQLFHLDTFISSGMNPPRMMMMMMILQETKWALSCFCSLSLYPNCWDFFVLYIKHENKPALQGPLLHS